MTNPECNEPNPEQSQADEASSLISPEEWDAALDDPEAQEFMRRGYEQERRLENEGRIHRLSTEKQADPSRLQRFRKVGSDILKMVITTDPREIASNLRQF